MVRLQLGRVAGAAICLLLTAVAVTAAAAADVEERKPMVGEVFRNAGGNWEFHGQRYSAVVHGKTGRLQSLVVEGRELLAQGDPKAAGGMLYAGGTPFVAALVPLNAFATVGAWDGNFGMWWHFLPDGIKLEYAVNQAEAPALTFVFNPEVVAGIRGPAPLAHRWLAGHILHEGWAYGEAGVTLLTGLRTPLAVQGLNVQALDAWNGRSCPAVTLPLPQGKRTGGEIHIGPALPAATASASAGFSGPRWHLFPATGKLEFKTPVRLDQAAGALSLDVAVLLLDFNTCRVLAEAVQMVALTPGQALTLNWSVPWTQPPGVYRGSVRVRLPGGPIGVHDFVLLSAVEQWRPELYRPADFWQFWEARLREMRVLPLDPKLELIPEKSDDTVKVYAVEVTGFGGRRIRGTYGEPTAPGKYPVILNSPHPGKALTGAAAEPFVGMAGEMEDVAKYRLNVGDLGKSNFLHVYLDFIRWLDFVDSRGKADWSRCVAPAGSRSGPIVIAAAALDSRIKLITMNVGTCNRWDWQVLYTAGWGPYLTDRLPGQSEAEFLQVLAYFDPSHFAEHVTIPVASSWGLMDGLSPANGQLSMWVNLRGPRFLELRETGGHDGNTPAFSVLTAELQRLVFARQPLPAAGPLGLNWETPVGSDAR